MDISARLVVSIASFVDIGLPLTLPMGYSLEPENQSYSHPSSAIHKYFIRFIKFLAVIEIKLLKNAV